MLVFVVRRLVVSFFILLASTALTYFLVAYSGNPLQDLLELRGPQRDAKIAQRTQDLNLDQPVWVRYLLWLQDVARCITPFGGACTLGSDRNGGAVLPQLQTAIGSTLRLVVVATILALLLGVVTGIVTALRQYSVFDYGVTFVAFLCFSLPVFWISTLLKQYVAIDLNTWLNNPVMTVGAIALLSVVVGLLWALIIGGDRRRALTVFGIGTLATGTVMYVLLTTDFFVEPYFGILGIFVFGAGAAVGWTALFAGLQHRGRPVLVSSLATVVFCTAAAFALQNVLADADWLIVFAIGIGFIAIGMAVGWLLGNPARQAGDAGRRRHRFHAGDPGRGRPAATGLSRPVRGHRRPPDQDHRLRDAEPECGLLGGPAGLPDVSDPADLRADAGVVRAVHPLHPGQHARRDGPGLRADGKGQGPEQPHGHRPSRIP